MRQPSTRWLLREPPDPSGALLLCFPYAGSGASSLRRWPSRVAGAQVCPVQLPGRENRIKEESYADFDTFAADAVEALGPYLDRPYAVAGHCMGALLAHAFTARAEQVGAPRPVRLFVSASLAPSRGFFGFYHPWMSERRIVTELQRVAGVLGDGAVPEELFALTVGVLRRDVRMCLEHAPPAVRLETPISAIAWDGDIDVSPADLAAWEEHGATRRHVLPGDPISFLAAPSSLRTVVEDDFVH